MGAKILKIISVTLSLLLAAVLGYLFNYIGEERKGTLRYLDIIHELM